jgi:hypothetical protein
VSQEIRSTKLIECNNVILSCSGVVLLICIRRKKERKEDWRNGSNNSVKQSCFPGDSFRSGSREISRL